MRSSGRKVLFDALIPVLLITLLGARPARADERLIVRAPGGLNVVHTLCNLVGCELLQGLGDPAGQLFVIDVSNLPLLNTLLRLLGIQYIEQDLLGTLLPPRALVGSGTAVPSGLLQSSPVSFFGAPVWQGYANQPAAGVIRASQARSQFGVSGFGQVAVIDTGIDPNHPALAGVLEPGYDFTRSQNGASEVADVTQSTVALIDGGPTPMNSWAIAVVDPYVAALIAGHSAFGHGTMVAGIVHLVAPNARILPLKAFKSNGKGYVSDIVRAIYFAVRSKADVLNMSFSLSSPSATLQGALNYAASQGVVSAAAVGNSGANQAIYPAGYTADVMGVASTTLTGARSSFSNYGTDVWVAAPGEGIISTYPFGTYAAGWGTSFSTPFVTGTADLVQQLRPLANEQQTAWAIGHAAPAGSGLGHGQLDVVRTLTAIKQGH